MEISKETKAKVFAQYLYQYVNSNKGRCRLRDMDFIENLEWISLKPLSHISDKDAIEVANICNAFSEPDNYIIERGKNGLGHNCIFFICKSEKHKAFTINEFGYLCGPHGIHPNPNYSLQAYQYLQSRGYDLPNYLLGGKTLKEVGLAIYEN